MPFPLRGYTHLFLTRTMKRFFTCGRVPDGSCELAVLAVNCLVTEACKQGDVTCDVLKRYLFILLRSKTYLYHSNNIPLLSDTTESIQLALIAEP